MAKIQIYLDQENPFTRDLTEEKITVGRLADNSIHLDEVSVSSHHAELFLKEGQYHLHDLGSTNGTFVNDAQVTDAILYNADRLRFGKVQALFNGDEETSEHPLPNSSRAEVTPGTTSERPANFISSSPFPKNVKKRNPLGVAAVVLAVIGFLAFAAMMADIAIMAFSS
ncbi:MAG: FHA domain-containing protein [Chthoniobacterales bacterium]